MKRVLVVILGAACGGDSKAVPDAPIPIDAAIDAPASTFSTCTGACTTTALTAAFAATRVLDKAYYGVTQSPLSLHVEAYKNAPAGCPTATSPSPDYTLVIGTVTIPMDPTPSTAPSSILDFKGDLLGGPIKSTATAVTLTPIAADQVMGATGFIALDVTMTFANGSLGGHLYATHCASMDE
jgi:hypothetical protein